jgi:hypothetical protein
MGGWLDWLVVGLLGTAVGTGEIVARYRDTPSGALRTAPALLYLAVNAIASLAALYLVRVFGWKFGVSGEEEVRWTQVLAAGFGAIVLFRSSLFTVRAGGQDVSIGPSNVLRSILTATDRAVDRIRGEARAIAVARAMAGVSFAKAHTALPTIALGLMQNLSQEEQEQFGRQIAALRAADLDEHAKTLALGLALMSLVGEGVLNAAVKSLGDQIRG